MKPFIAAIALVLMVASPAYARGHHGHRHHHRHHYQHIVVVHSFQEGLGHGLEHMMNSARPHAWCGWYMRQLEGVRDPAYNLAANWAHWGYNAGGPGIGVIVVWSHHVGKIVGEQNGQWVIESGNDGHAVRTRPRSVAGAIAFRHG